MKNFVFLLVKMTKSIATSLLDFFIRLVKAALFNQNFVDDEKKINGKRVN
jgi:hypothetical protein